MEKTRVKKGEHYYWIMSSDGKFISIYDVNTNAFVDRERMKNRNYFNTEKEADAVARKLNAVLNGAEILEDWQKEKIASWDTMLETKDEISKNYSKLLNNPKLQAVLKGADVIEMPSEEDASFESVHLLGLSGHDDGERREEAYLDGFADCLHWLKSKVK